MVEQTITTMPMVTILGPPGSVLGYAIRDFLYRSDVPSTWVPLPTDAQARLEAEWSISPTHDCLFCVFADGIAGERIPGCCISAAGRGHNRRARQ